MYFPSSRPIRERSSFPCLYRSRIVTARICNFESFDSNDVIRLEVINVTENSFNGAMTFSITTLGITGLHVTLSISDTQYTNVLQLCWVALWRVSSFIYCYAVCRFAECHCGECHGALSIPCLQMNFFSSVQQSIFCHSPTQATTLG